MKLSNLTRASSAILGSGKSRRTARHAARLARKDDLLKKQITDAQAKAKTEVEPVQEQLNAHNAAVRRETLLRKQGTPDPTLLLLDELTTRVVELESLQELSTQALEKLVASLKRGEQAVIQCEKEIRNLQERDVALSERLIGAQNSIDERFEALNLRLLEVEQSAMLADGD